MSNFFLLQNPKYTKVQFFDFFLFSCRCYLWLQRAYSCVWTFSCIRNEINKSQADKWFPICWHEHLQHCRSLSNHCTCGNGYCKLLVFVQWHAIGGNLINFFFLFLFLSSFQASQQDASYAFVALAVIFCCFLSMLLIFVPKVSIWTIGMKLILLCLYLGKC